VVNSYFHFYPPELSARSWQWQWRRREGRGWLLFCPAVRRGKEGAVAGAVGRSRSLLSGSVFREKWTATLNRRNERSAVVNLSQCCDVGRQRCCQRHHRLAEPAALCLPLRAAGGDGAVQAARRHRAYPKYWRHRRHCHRTGRQYQRFRGADARCSVCMRGLRGLPS
jgi:hypothetical protein